MNKDLIIADVHNKCLRVEEIIKHENPSRTFLLGDYFDSYDENIDDIRETATWFEWSVSKPDRIHLCGNHDLPYRFPKYEPAYCPGFTQFKSMLINDIVPHKVWDKLIFHHNLDDKWLLSHAGVHPKYACGTKPGQVGRSDIRTIDKWLKEESEKFLIAAGRKTPHWFVDWSRKRSGNINPGGILWCDFEGDLNNILGVNQIVGHSANIEIRWKYNTEGDFRHKWYEGVELVPKYSQDASYSLCLDTFLTYYAIWDGKSLEIKKLPHS